MNCPCMPSTVLAVTDSSTTACPPPGSGQHASANKCPATTAAGVPRVAQVLSKAINDADCAQRGMLAAVVGVALFAGSMLPRPVLSVSPYNLAGPAQEIAQEPWQVVQANWNALP